MGWTRRLGQLVSSYRSSLAHSVELRVWIVVVQSHWDLISAEEMQSAIATYSSSSETAGVAELAWSGLADLGASDMSDQAEQGDTVESSVVLQT